MIHYQLHFCLVPPKRLSERAEKKWDREHAALLRPLVDKMTSLGDCWVVLTPPRAAELLQFFKSVRKEGGQVNIARLKEELADDDKTPVEWFVVDPASGSSEGFAVLVWDLREPVEDDDIHLQVRADRMKPGVHVAGWTPLVYVSERFKAVVEAHRFRGIEFVWCRDIGRYRAPQWYYPVCRNCLGRGVDHPWINTTKLSGRGSATLDSRGRHGQTGAFGNMLKRDAGAAEPLLKELQVIELLKRRPDFGSFPRYLRKYLPNTDFACTIEDWDGSRHRGLAMNRKAWELLRANRVLTEEECQAVLILDRAPPAVENLDRRYGPAEPAFAAEQWARIRAHEAGAWARHLAHPKLPRAPNLARSLALLRFRKRREAKVFARPASPTAIAGVGRALGAALPTAWEKVLRICNGGRVEHCPLASDQVCLIIPTSQLAQAQGTESDYYRQLGADLPDSLVVIMQTEFGDSVWLDPSRQAAEGDCRVVLMSHETGEPEREWSSVADFLEELLLPEQDQA
jgi:hypothetical protein